MMQHTGSESASFGDHTIVGDGKRSVAVRHMRGCKSPAVAAPRRRSDCPKVQRLLVAVDRVAEHAADGVLVLRRRAREAGRPRLLLHPGQLKPSLSERLQALALGLRQGTAWTTAAAVRCCHLYCSDMAKPASPVPQTRGAAEFLAWRCDPGDP